MDILRQVLKNRNVEATNGEGIRDASERACCYRCFGRASFGWPQSLGGLRVELLACSACLGTPNLAILRELTGKIGHFEGGPSLLITTSSPYAFSFASDPQQPGIFTRIKVPRRPRLARARQCPEAHRDATHDRMTRGAGAGAERGAQELPWAVMRTVADGIG